MLLIDKKLLLLFKIILHASFVGLFKTKHKKLFWFILYASYIMATEERYHILRIISVAYHEERNHFVFNHRYSFDIIIRALNQVQLCIANMACCVGPASPCDIF